MTACGNVGEFPAELGASRKANVRSADLPGMAYYFCLAAFVVLPVCESEQVAKPRTSHPCYCRSAIRAQFVAGFHPLTFVGPTSDLPTCRARLFHAPLDVFA